MAGGVYNKSKWNTLVTMLQMCWNTWKELYQETYPKWEIVRENLL